MKYFRLLGIMAMVSLLLAACGGGGGGSSDPVPAAPTVSGVAAVGAPIAGQVWLKDATGSEVGPVATGTGGAFSIDVTGLEPPYFLEVIGTANGNPVRLRGVGFSTGIVNINPFSETAIFVATGIDPAQVYANLVAMAPIDLERALVQALESIRQMIALLLAEVNQSFGNPCRDRFVADGTGLDGVLDMISLQIDATNNLVQVRERINDGVVASGELNAGIPRLMNILAIQAGMAQDLVTHFGPTNSGQGNSGGGDHPTLTGVAQYPYNLLEVVEEEDFDGNGQADWVYSMAFQYDGEGRLTGRVITDGFTGMTTTVTETWEYDGSGQLSGISDSQGGSLSLGYAAGNLVAVNGSNFGMTGNNFLMTLTPNASGELEALIKTNTNTMRKTRYEFSYDSRGLVTGLQESTSQMNQTTYTPTGSATTTYDASGRLLTSEEYDPFLGTAPYQVWTYSYDTNGRLEQVTCDYDDDGDGVKEGLVTMSLSYDGVGNLRQVLYEDDFDRNGVVDSSSTTTYTFRDGGMPSEGFARGMVPYNMLSPLADALLWEWSGFEN